MVAQSDVDVAATVAVSLFSPVVTASSPRNLLVIVGALEPAMLREEGLRIANLAAGGGTVAGQTYRYFLDGTARRLAVVHGVEHIGVLYSHDSMIEALRWLKAAFGKREESSIDASGPWPGLLFVGVVALAWSLSPLLPIVGKKSAGSDFG
jgi:hypothetical protein